MGITRRSFLSCAAGTAAMGLPFDLWRIGRTSSVVETDARCVLLDLKAHGGLTESVAGFATALASLGTRFMWADPRAVSRCAVLIVPGAVEIPPPAVRAIVSCLEAGASVIRESGAGFAPKPEFRAQRAVLRDALHVEIDAPVHLWAARPGQRIPYIDYTWPHAAKLRDFSRVVPLGRQAGEIIARVDGLPVGITQRRGRGTLIFLGSPLGPALWAGDSEARRWLLGVLRKRVP